MFCYGGESINLIEGPHLQSGIVADARIEFVYDVEIISMMLFIHDCGQVDAHR